MVVVSKRNSSIEEATKTWEQINIQRGRDIYKEKHKKQTQKTLQQNYIHK